MKVRREYEVTITPEGRWTIRFIHGEHCTTVATGQVDDTHNAMGRATEQALRWLDQKKSEEADLKRRAEGNKVFTVPA